MESRRNNYHSYLLRLWRESETEEWRVALEDVQNGEKRNFAGIPALVQFLESLQIMELTNNDKQ